MKGHAFLIFSASLLIAVIFGSRQDPTAIAISGIESDLAAGATIRSSLAFGCSGCFWCGKSLRWRGS